MCGEHIFHFHVADSNRKYPSAGHLDLNRLHESGNVLATHLDTLELILFNIHVKCVGSIIRGWVSRSDELFPTHQRLCELNPFRIDLGVLLLVLHLVHPHHHLGNPVNMCEESL